MEYSDIRIYNGIFYYLLEMRDDIQDIKEVNPEVLNDVHELKDCLKRVEEALGSKNRPNEQGR